MIRHTGIFASMAALAAMAAATSEPATSRVTDQSASAHKAGATGKTITQGPRAPGANLLGLIGNAFARGSLGKERRSGPGWSQAQVQRRARKARNVKRHRAACRG